MYVFLLLFQDKRNKEIRLKLDPTLDSDGVIFDILTWTARTATSSGPSKNFSLDILIEETQWSEMCRTDKMETGCR